MPLSDAEAYEKYADDLVRFATGLVGPHDAQDVVAEAFVKVIKSRNWPNVENPKSYFYRSVLNEVRMRHRATLRRRARERMTAGPGVTYQPEVRPEVIEALRTLSPRQRAAVVLAYWEGLTPADISTRLGIGEGSVRKHLARARATLREVLDV